jgi:nicotinate-nucleotide adenylyltransferase
MIVGIFGGTFDPPHVGHLGAARAALDSGEVDEVWLVPVLAHRFEKTPAPFEHRVAMCRLLVAGDDRMKVSEMERELERPGYTLDLVEALRRAHPEASFRLIAGADIYHERYEWHRYDEIAALAPPLYVARGGVAPIPAPTLPEPPPAVASEIRAALARGERPAGVLSGEVLAYIETHQLYGEA